MSDRRDAVAGETETEESTSSTKKVDGRKVRGRQTKEAILEAAEKEFADHGILGTSMRHLAEACGTSQASLHFHFDTKENLYDEVRKNVAANYIEIQSALIERNVDDATFLIESTRNYFRFFLQRDHLSRLSTWAMLEKHDPGWGRGGLMMKTMGERIQRAHEKNLIRPEVTPLYAVTLVGGLIAYWNQYRSFFVSEFFEEECTDDEAFYDQALEMVIRAIGTQKLIDFWQKWKEQQDAGADQPEQSRETT